MTIATRTFACILLTSITATAANTATLNSLSRSEFNRNIEGYDRGGDDFDDLNSGSNPATVGVSYGASEGEVIATNEFLSSSFPNSLVSTSAGFFTTTESVELRFAGQQTAFGIDVNTFATTTGSYTAKFNNGDEVKSRFAPFDARATGQFIGYIGALPFTSVVIEAVTGFSYTLDTLSFGSSDKSPSGTPSVPDRASQGASVISALRNYVAGAKNTEKTYLERLNECAAQGAECDFDAAKNDEEFRQNLQNANEATFASKDLVTRTSLLPQNKLELAADAPTLVSEIKAFFQWIGVLPEEENRDQLINASVEGESGEFTVNPTFTAFALTYVLDFDGPSFFEDLVGEQFLFNKSFGDKGLFAGHGIIDFAGASGPSSSRAILTISQLETNDTEFFSNAVVVPLPAGVYLLLSGLLGLAILRRRQHTSMT